MVEILKKQEQKLTNLRDQLTLQKEEIEKCVEEKEKMFKLLEKDMTEEYKSLRSSPGYMKLKDIISQYKWNLNNRQEALEKLIINIEKVLYDTEHVINETETQKETENTKTSEAERSKE